MSHADSPRCRTRHRKRWVATVTAASSGAPRLLRWPWRNRNAASDMRNRGRVHWKGDSVSPHPRCRMGTCGTAPDPAESGQGAAAGPSRLHRGGEAARRARARSRPARVDPRLPGAARRARRGAEPRRRGLRPGGSRLRGAAPRQELRHRPRSGQRKALAAERSAVRA